jgi:hypothetical protein
VNHIELHTEIQERLIGNHGTLEKALHWMCELLNAKDLDEWARAWSANNNVNNYELEMLPVETTSEMPELVLSIQ